LYADLRQDARLCACREECDRDLAAEARAGGCLVWGCLEWGGPVHAARYARKRRGGSRQTSDRGSTGARASAVRGTAAAGG